MADWIHVRRRKLINQAEGYLELVMGLDGWTGFGFESAEGLARKSLSLLNQYEAMGGRNRRANFLKGHAYRLIGNFESAVGCYWRALESDHQNPQIYLALAFCYKHLDEMELAIETLTNAKEIAPTNSLVIYNMACYFALVGDVMECCGCLSRAFAIDSELRDRVQDEPDFESIRRHPFFLDLLSTV